MSPAELDPNPPLAFFRQMASALLTRFDLARKAGKTFKGKRDVYEALGYQVVLTAEDYRDRYRRNGVATRIVETYPKSTWRKGGLVTDNETVDDSPFDEAWKALAKRLKIWPTFKNLDVLTGLGEYGVLLIGVQDGSPLSEPLPTKFSADKLIYLQPFGQEDVDVEAVVVDAQNARFGQPETYVFSRIGIPKGELRGRARQRGRDTTTTTVHWSRVIHVAEDLLDDKVFGKPRLRNVWNYLDDLDKVAGGGAEAFWMRANPGYVASIDKDLEIKPEDLKDMQAQIEEFAHTMRRTIGQRGIDFKALSADVADYSNPVAATFMLISAATGIPKRILMGSERGELASTQDATNFDDRVDDRREQFAEPVVVRPFVDLLIAAGALPPPLDDDYMAKWPQLSELDVKDKTRVAVQMSMINKNEGGTVYTKDELREVTDHAPLEEIDIEEDDDDDMIFEEEEGEEEEPEAAAGKEPSRQGPIRAPSPNPNGGPSTEPPISTRSS